MHPLSFFFCSSGEKGMRKGVNPLHRAVTQAASPNARLNHQMTEGAGNKWHIYADLGFDVLPSHDARLACSWLGYQTQTERHDPLPKTLGASERCIWRTLARATVMTARYVNMHDDVLRGPGTPQPPWRRVPGPLPAGATQRSPDAVAVPRPAAEVRDLRKLPAWWPQFQVTPAAC